MSVHRFSLTIIAAVVALGLGMMAGERVGEATGSVWGAAAVGFALSILIAAFIEPVMREGARAGFISRNEDQSYSLGLTAITSVFLIAFSLYLILGDNRDASGFVNYTQPVIGGFWSGMVVAMLFGEFRSARKDSAS